MPIRTREGCLTLLAALLLVLLTPGADPAPAATYTITTLAEDDVVNGNCTLREALLASIQDSTHDQCMGDVGPDTIVLQATGSYALDDGNLSGAARTLTVRGAAGQPRASYVVALGDAQRFLSVSGGFDLTLENLTLSDGAAGAQGGALEIVDSNLTLRDVAITSSHADNGGALLFRAHGSEHLDVENARFEGNQATANQASGGALWVDLQAGTATVRIVSAQFVGNGIVSASGNFSRHGAGLAVNDFSGDAIELRHLLFDGNTIDAPSFAAGAGLYLGMTTGSLLGEDLRFVANALLVDAATNGAVALDASLQDLSTATLRRLEVRSNPGGSTRSQAILQANGSTPLVLSDVLVGPGTGSGLFLSTGGGAGASLLAGNLTVAGNAGTGLTLAENSGTLRVENSIVSGNATVSGTNLQIFNGTPDVSAEVLVGGSPGFVDAGAGDFQLAPGSPAVGAGNAAFASVGPYDLPHGTRVVGVQIDLGAYEQGAIFADGFEREDLWAWSTSTGGS